MTIDEGVAFAVEHKAPSRPAPPAKAPPDTGLTRRQLEIVRLIADDLTNKQIAARLFLSDRTVETHVTNILNNLGLSSRVQLTRWLAEQTEAGLPRQANPRSAAADSEEQRAIVKAMMSGTMRTAAHRSSGSAWHQAATSATRSPTISAALRA